MSETVKPCVTSRVIDFPEGSISVSEGGTITFFFRNMKYVYERGRDAAEGMQITVGKETAAGIKRLFHSVWNNE